jgi:predicted signal transduction protein with EAL and GGDEF domain
LREQATRDKLTGLLNRHYLNARFEQEIARAKRNGGAAAVTMFDIDHFKRFNDTFGHPAGDHVLRSSPMRFGARGGHPMSHAATAARRIRAVHAGCIARTVRPSAPNRYANTSGGCSWRGTGSRWAC